MDTKEPRQISSRSLQYVHRCLRETERQSEAAREKEREEQETENESEAASERNREKCKRGGRT